MPSMSSVYNELSAEELERAKDLGTRMRIARQRRDWTQKALSEKTGISAGTIKKMESGNPRVPLAFWLKVMDVFSLAHEFDGLLQPDNDRIGAATETKDLRMRVRPRNNDPDGFEFNL